MNSTKRFGTVALSLLAACGAACSSGHTKAPAAANTRQHQADAVVAGRPVSPEAAAWGSAYPQNSTQSRVNTATYGVSPNTQLVAIAASGTPDATENVRQVTFAQEGSDFDPSLSPNASLVYFSSTRHRETADIYVQGVSGSAVTQLTSHPAQDVMPTASPDGSYIAFASNRESTWDIFTMPATGGQPTRITSDNTPELHPSWSHDGTRLAYCKLGERSGRWEIWVTDTTKPAAHTFVAYGLFPKWHPTTDRILFQRSRDRGERFFSIWTIDLENGEGVHPTEVASTADVAFINPAWSPDGARIACAAVTETSAEDFAMNPNARALPPVRADLWVFNADGSGRINLTGGWFVNSMPTWATDGRIYFVSDRGGPEAIWSINPGGTSAPIIAATATVEPTAPAPVAHEIPTVHADPAPVTHVEDETPHQP